MPEVILNCPRCQRQLRVTEDLIGRPVKCPACQMMFTVPAGVTDAQPVQPPTGTAEAPQTPMQPIEPWGTPGEFESQRSRRLPREPWYEDDHEAAARALMPPAIALLLVGALGILFNVLRVANALIQGVPAPEDFPEAFRPFLKLVTPQLLIGEAVVFLVIGLVVVAGAIQMVRHRMYPLAIAASIAALFHFDCPCCVLGIPFGIWAFVVLLRPDVRALFRTFDV
jgi:predicted Zn finger-like uncharacterized protein